MNHEDVILGQKYRDTVSGWEGVATARYEYMNGCVRIEISGADDKGAPTGFVFDAQQVDAVTPPPESPTDAIETIERPKVRTGGPRDNTPLRR